MLKLAFFKGGQKGIANKLRHRIVCVFTCGRYSHVELIFPDWVAGHENSFTSSGMDGGVRFRHIDYSHPKRWKVIPVKWIQKKHIQAIYDWARSFVGKKYDWPGILFTFGLKKKKDKQDQWWCSEICALLVGIFPYKISPSELLKQADLANFKEKMRQK